MLMFFFVLFFKLILVASLQLILQIVAFFVFLRNLNVILIRDFFFVFLL